MICRTTLWIGVSFLMGACASTTAVKKGYDFSRIQKVAVLDFRGSSYSGNIVADEFVRQLIFRGIDVVERTHLQSIIKEQDLRLSGGAEDDDLRKAARILGVDAFFTGTVSLFQPDQRFLIMVEEDAGVIQNPVIRLNSSRYVRRDRQIDDDTYVLFSGAVVGVSARMIDARSGSIVWADSMTYEAFEASHAVTSIVRFFLRSLEPHWRTSKAH